MGNNLNPDGAKIKALRIQRGWTQEQLAEIAGISTRTIQRAERMNTAAFETLKAIAVAFDMDFDQILKTESCDVSNPAPQGIGFETFSSIDREAVSPTPTAHPIFPSRRIWPAYALAVSGLVTGLVAGVSLTFHLITPAASNPTTAAAKEAAMPQAGLELESAKPATNAQQAVPMEKPAPNPTFHAEKARQTDGVKQEKNEYPSFIRLATATSSAADLISPGDLRLTPQPALHELPPKSRDFFSTHAIEEIMLAPVYPATSTGNMADNEEATGAVRQALGQAAKKTGSFMSKVGTSLKRAL